MAAPKKAATPKKEKPVGEVTENTMGAKYVKARTGRLLMLRKAAKKGN
jgi:hypothetical protein